MGGVEPPFLYDPPSRYSFNGPTDKGFNPKSATIASWTLPAPKPKQDGPLINFNIHPDSYLVVPYGNLNAKPMGPNTKSKVKWSRSIQLFLRICELLGAIGMLICVICIKGTPDTTGWIIRASPAVGLLHTVYGTYHLARKATGRTPASTASYMVFAAMIDTGLIPFYVFSAMMSKTEYSSGDKVWGTLFTDPKATPKIVRATYLFSVTNGGFHLASLLASLYLAIIFRKISKLPPDMNPLEDNLTARPHKRNKSSISVVQTSGEKHLSQTTTASSNRMSNQPDSLISQTRRVPFMHTRTDSTDSLTGRNFHTSPDSKRSSRVDLPGNQPYQNTNASAGSSRVDIPMQPPFYQQPNQSARSSRTKLSTAGHTPPANPIPLTEKPLPGKHQLQTTRSSLLKDNWFTYPAPTPSPPITPSYPDYVNNNENEPPSPVSDSPLSTSSCSQTNTGISSIKDFDLNLRNAVFKSKHSSYQPVQTDSPAAPLYDFDRDLATPAPPQFFDADAEFIRNNRHQSPQSQPSDSDPTLKSPAKKKDHTRSHTQTQIHTQNTTPTKSAKQFWQQQEWQSSPNRPSPLELNPPTPPPNRQMRPSLAGADGNSRPSSFVGSGGKGRFYGDLRQSLGTRKGSLSSREPNEDGKGRVVSNSGADFGVHGNAEGTSAYSKLGGLGAMGISGISGMGGGRRRDVSGKVAEEGRIGGGGGGGASWWDDL